MKKKLLTLSLLILSVVLLRAQLTVEIGSNSTTTNLIPVNQNTAYSYTQQIILQSEINTAGEITKIRFNMTGTSINNSNVWVIYFGHTNKSVFSGGTDWVPVSAMTQVFSGTLPATPPAGWMEITLNTPFTFNNIDNLVIAVDDNKAQSNSGSSFRAWSSGANRALRAFNSSTNINPATPGTGSFVNLINHIQFNMIPASNVENPIAFSATAISTSEIKLDWQKNNNNEDVIIAVNNSSQFGLPTNGNNYTSGDIIPNGGTVVYAGSDTTFIHNMLNSNTVYHYKIWSVCPADTFSVGLTALDTTFARYFPVTFNAPNGNGYLAATALNPTIPLTSGDTIRETTNILFSAVPNTNFRVKEWTINDTIYLGYTNNTLNFNNLLDTLNVIVEFEPIPTYIVEYNVVLGNGTLSATANTTAISTGASVEENSTIVFTATPNPSYIVKEWKLNDTIITGWNQNTYTLTPLNRDIHVTVEFLEVPSHLVTFNVINGNGDLTASVNSNPIQSNTLVEAGRNIVFTAIPNNGYQVLEWKLNGNVIPGNTFLNYQLQNLQAPSLVTVEFTLIPVTNYTLTLNVNPSTAGTASGAGDYSPGTNIPISTTPSSGNYQFINWTLNGTPISTNPSFNYLMPASNTTLVANYQNTTQITENQNNNFKFYPNPTKNQINVETDQAGMIVIVNPLGQIVYSESITKSTDKINLPNLTNGIYILTFSNKNSHITQKLFID